MVSAVHIDRCDVTAEMDSLASRIDSTTTPWTDLENTAVSFSARLSLLYSQLVRLCIGSPAISSTLLRGYEKFRDKMLSELFFFMESTPSDLSKCITLDKMFSLVSKSRYLERLPRFPIFCPELDISETNWGLVVEERILMDSDMELNGRNLSENKTASATLETGTSFEMKRHGSLPEINSRFSWFRRKSKNGTRMPRSFVRADSRRRLESNAEPCAEVSFTPEDGFQSIVEFVMERERLKMMLKEQNVFDGFLYSEQASPWKYAPLRSTEAHIKHLVVFVHGLEGSCDDLSSYRNIFRLVSANVPGFHYLLSASNHAKTWSDIDQMADNLLEEVHSYMTRYSELPTRVSFVAHSLGGVIVRAAVSREEASEWLVPRLHCLLTINSPHLGLAYVGKGVNLGIQFMQWWKQSRSMEQLALKDEVLFGDSFLFRLSKKRTFGHFRRVLLIGTPADVFVPCHSALLASCKAANKDPSALGIAYREMLSNIHDDIVSSDRTVAAVRYSTWHTVSSPKASKFTGRAAHIAAVEDDVY